MLLGLIFLSTGALVVFMALAFAGLAIYRLLAIHLEPWLAALSVGAILLAIGIVLMLLGRRKLYRTSSTAVNLDQEADPISLLQREIAGDLGKGLSSSHVALIAALAGFLIARRRRPSRQQRNS
jgi:hypothetical protein